MLAPVQTPSDTSVLRQGKLIGRREQLDKIKAAITETGSHVFFLTGEGGIGKTRLQQEIGQHVKTLQAEDENSRLLWSGIIDLYHSDMHSNSRIEQALIKQLDEKHDFFQVYEQKRQAFEKQRLAGLMGTDLERAREELTKAFIHGFNRLTAAYRVVLAFDTLELVQYESSIVSELCEVEEETSSVKNWLLEQVGQMKNSVIIFAGRPHTRVQADFERYFQNKACDYDELFVERFGFDETREYLYELANRYDVLGNSLNSTTIQQIYQGADNGRPIYISLAADLLSFGEEISDLFPPTETTADENYLKQLRQYIARRLLTLPGIQGFIVRYLAIARQGLDEALLEFLLEGQYAFSEIQQAMEQMRAYTFVKTHPHNPDQLFLHDEVYDILDEFHLDDRQDVERVYKRLRDYYESKRKAAIAKRDSLGPLTDQSETNRQTYEDLLQEIADLTATTLYYELQVDPLVAYYQKYVRWDEEAINAYQVGHDMRLRDVVLTFYNTLTRQANTSRKEWLVQRIPHDEVSRMNALLWLRRYLARGQNEKCYRIANKLKKCRELVFEWDNIDDRYYKATLLTMTGEAMKYTPKENTLTELDKAIALLEPIESATPPNKDERDEVWRRARILGQAYNNKAFVYRSIHKYSTAVFPYRKAIALYRQVDIRDEMAIAINNLAFVYAKLGALHEAEALAKDALDLRAQLWQRYPLSLSYNTLGEVHVAAQHPHQARGLSSQALKFASPLGRTSSESTGFARGQALAHLALGKAFRGLGFLTKNLAYSYDETVQHYEQSRDHLLSAIEFFDHEKKIKPDSKPTDYEVEARAERGRLYRDWMSLHLQYKDKGSAQERKDLAVKYLKEALMVAEERVMVDDMANILEDLARLYWILKDRDATQKFLDQAESLIPNEYKPKVGKGLLDISKPINPFWAILGKIFLLRAETIFNPDDYYGPLNEQQVNHLLEAMEYRVLAAACFEKFSPYANSDPLMKETKIALYNSLKRYGVPRLQLILDRIHEVEGKYKVNIESILDYIDKTMGFYLILGE